MSPDRCEVVGAYVPDERHLAWNDAGLALQPIEGRVGLVGERDEINRSGADDTGNCAHLLHFSVEECHSAVEVLVPEQRSLEGQQPLGPQSEVGVSQVLEGLQEQAAAGQQHHSERGLEHDEGMLEPVAARAGSASTSVAEPFLRGYTRATERGRQPENDGCCYGCGGGEAQHAPVERQAYSAHRLGNKRFQKTHGGKSERESGGRAESGEHQAFGKELSDESSASGAKRGADGYFPAPRRAARHQQIGQIDARNQQ